MRISFILFFLFAPLFAKEQAMKNTVLGPGLFYPSLGQDYPLYRSFNDDKPFSTLSIRQNTNGALSFNAKGFSLKPYRIYEGDTPEQAERHILSGLTYLAPRLTLRVIEKRGDAFLVALNEEKNETAVLRAVHSEAPPNDFSFLEGQKLKSIYLTWEQYLLRVLGIRAKGITVIYDRPGGKEIFRREATLPYQAQAVDGEYIRVKKAFNQEAWFEGLKNTEGWMRWSDGNKLLIDITEFGLK